MSSEGSVSSNGSRIRQFGLYRSIDARTEEFLRLSRRRQIRQGCACAAVSTAVTVAVVVVVIFVYEFRLNSEVNIGRTNWFSLINDTTENGFKTKFTESGIDKSTLILLPILLKALKKNVILEKFLEEQSVSSSPVYEEKDATEYHFEKNVFTKNWFRIPSSKVYAIAYNTLPSSYYKSSSKKLEYFTKIRKIRDYQRVINYMDKMISEKVYIGSTKPMVKEEINTETPLTTTVPRSEIKPNYQIKPVSPRTKTIIDLYEKNAENNKKSFNCKCPMKLGTLLLKVLHGIEKLLSINTRGETSPMADCHQAKNFNLDNVDEKLAIPGIHEIEVPTIKTDNFTSKEDNDKNIQIKATSQSYKKTIEQVSEINNQNNNDVRTIEISTLLLNDHLDVTDTIPKIVTKPMKSNNNIKNNIKLDHYQNDISSINENKSNDYLTTPEAIDSFHKDNGLEFVNKRTTQTEKLRQDTFGNRKIKAFIPKSYKKPQFVYSSILTKNNWLKNLKKAINQKIERNKNIQMKPMPTETTTKIFKIELTEKTARITDLNTILIKQAKKKNKKIILSKKIDEATRNQSSFVQEDNTNIMLNPIENPKDSSTKTDAPVTEVLWEELKNENNIPAWKSMIPNHRQIYLEIEQKNDWKHEEQDYDFNFINTYDNIPD